LKNKKYFSLPVTFTEIKDYSYDDSLIPVDIKVMHDGLNLNNSTFFEEAINDAKESLKNKPILGYIKKVDGTDQKDFAGHEIEISFGEDGVKVIYLERPLGVVPESNNYAIQEEDNKKYVTCRGYLWKEYLNQGYEILKDNPNKSVSMEIAVDGYEINTDGTINITKFRYLGITILGDDVIPAMQGAELNVVGQFSEKVPKDFYSKIEKLNEDLKKYQDQQKTSKECKTSDKGGESVVTSKFATYNQKRDALRNALDSEIVRDDDGNIIEETYYWVADFDDEYVYVERSHWFEDDYESDYGRFTYEFNEETIEATITGEFEKMILVWLTEEENQLIEEQRNQFTQISNELETLKDEHSTLQENYNTLESEVNKLREFKSSVEKARFEEQQNELFELYDELLKDNAEYTLLKENKNNYTIEELEKELALLYVKSNNKFSKKDTKKKIKIGVNLENDKVIQSPYGDLSLKFNKQ